MIPYGSATASTDYTDYVYWARREYSGTETTAYTTANRGYVIDWFVVETPQVKPKPQKHWVPFIRPTHYELPVYRHRDLRRALRLKVCKSLILKARNKRRRWIHEQRRLRQRLAGQA